MKHQMQKSRIIYHKQESYLSDSGATVATNKPKMESNTNKHQFHENSAQMLNIKVTRFQLL